MDKKKPFYIFNMMIQFFTETFVAMVIGYFLGKWLDELLFDSRSIFMYILVIFGIFAGLRNFIVRALANGKGEEKDDEEKGHN